MNKIVLITFSFIVIATLHVTGQEADPYADYEYLWQDQSKKKKKKKRKKSEVREKSVSADSIPSPESVMLSDSLSQDSTVQQLATQEPIVEQAPEDYYDNPFGEAEEEEAKKSKAKSNADWNSEINDFRTKLSPAEPHNSVTGGVTFTRIDGQNFVGMSLSPEFRIWKIGLGLDIPILFSMDDGSFRDEIYKDGVGVGRLIRYLSYGKQKQDQIYARVGQIDNVMIGYGGLVNNYTNSVSFEKRKLGLHYDLHFRGLVGIEGMYSDFDPASRNLLVTRPYVRPMAWSPIPIVSTIEVGTTLVSDRDQTEIALDDSTSFTYDFLQNDGIKAFGIDAGITLLQIPFIQIDAFFNYSKLSVQDGGLGDFLAGVDSTSFPTLENGFQDGSGTSFGLNFRLNFIADIFRTDVRIERLNYTEHYLPQFFDVSYELNKDARIFSTIAAPEMSGIYGSLTGHILGIVELGGSLLLPDQVGPESPATVRVHGDVHRLADKVSLHATYMKAYLDSLEDAFKLDDRSVAQVRFIYHMNQFLAMGVDYYWSFTPTADGGVEATSYVSPYFGVSIDF